MFHSGGFEPTGAITGNDNDSDATRFEPHYREIDSPDQVQVYEAIMATADGTVTTGLLSAVSYVKDNRVTPRGFEKEKAPGDVAVHGDALEAPDFIAGQDRVKYRVDLAKRTGPFSVGVELWYQSVAYRWAQNLKIYTAAETQRFASYYDQMAPNSAVRLTSVTAVTR